MAEDESDVSFEDVSDDEGNTANGAGKRKAASGGRKAARKPSPSEDEDEDDEQLDRSYMGKWADVDTAEIVAIGNRLLNNIVTNATNEDRREEAWQPPPSFEAETELVDPLGLGRLDLTNFRIERVGETEPVAATTASSGPLMPKAETQRGRFISSLAQKPPGVREQAQPTGQSAVRKDDRNSSRKYKAQSTFRTAASLNRVLPNAEGFDAEVYLSTFHENTDLDELASGMRTLDMELSERTGQLKQLVKANFERFISCKNTIDDIYTKLQRIEQEKKKGISTEILYDAIQEVQKAAQRMCGPVLERQAKAERIKNVMNLLKRFNVLFNMPSRIARLAAERDYEQVIAEYKKANGLIQPGQGTARVWASLHAEIEKRVTDAFLQIRDSLRDPHVSADDAPALVVHALQLAAEGLPAAQGVDPLTLYLDNMEAYFTTLVQQAQEQHERRVAQLRERYRSALAASRQGPFRSAADGEVDEHELLTWTGDPEDQDYVPPMHDMMDVLAQGQSRLVDVHAATSAQRLYTRHVSSLCSLMLDTLPPFWQLVTSTRLTNPTDVPPEARETLLRALQRPVRMVARFTDTFCACVNRAVDVLDTLGPMQPATQLVLQDVAHMVLALKERKAPKQCLASASRAVFHALALAVRQLCTHLAACPSRLLAMEEWAIHLGNSQPLTQMPEFIQDEVIAVLHHYRQLVGLCGGLDSRGLPAESTWKPLQSAFFAMVADYCTCVGQLAACFRVSPEELQGRLKMTGFSAAASLTLPDDDTLEGEEGGAGAGGATAGGVVGGVGPPAVGRLLSRDVQLLLMLSNTSWLMSRQLPGMTGRALDLLAGGEAGEQRAVRMKLEGAVSALQGLQEQLLGVYLDRKKAIVLRALARYIRDDAPVNSAAADLQDITDACLQLGLLVVAVHAELSSYSPNSLSAIMAPLLAFLVDQLSSRYAALPTSVPAGAVLQCYLDLSYLDAVLSGLASRSLRAELDAAYVLLANRLAPTPAAGKTAPSPAELNRKMQGICRGVLPAILDRMAMNTRCFARV